MWKCPCSSQGIFKYPASTYQSWQSSVYLSEVVRDFVIRAMTNCMHLHNSYHIAYMNKSTKRKDKKHMRNEWQKIGNYCVVQVKVSWNNYKEKDLFVHVSKWYHLEMLSRVVHSFTILTTEKWCHRTPTQQIKLKILKGKVLFIYIVWSYGSLRPSLIYFVSKCPVYWCLLFCSMHCVQNCFTKNINRNSLFKSN